MKKNLTAVVLAAAMILSVGSVYAAADYGYDYTTDYNYTDTYDTYDTYTDTTTTDYGYYDTYTDYGTVSSESDTSSISPIQPAVVTLETSAIEDYKFTAKLKISADYAFTAADITINYDTEVLDLLSNEINTEAGGTGVGAETEEGVFQYQYINSYGSEYEEEYLTLSFEIIDSLQRSTVIYTTVNSFLDTLGVENTTTADGTVIQIEGAVPVDASADESSYSELRVYKSDEVIEYSTLGLSDVKSVTFEDGELATAESDGINALSEGITNMTVEFNDGTFKYYRLVITSPDSSENETAVNAETVISQTDSAAATDAGTVTETQENSSKKVKYMIIYVLVILAIVALFIEGFVILGNPYSKAAKLMKQREGNPDYDDDDMFPESLDYGSKNEYDELDEVEYNAEESEESRGEDTEDTEASTIAENESEQTEEETEAAEEKETEVDTDDNISDEE